MDSHKIPNPESDPTQSALIKVFGVGGGGCNALEQMIAAGIRDVEFKCINTDAQALSRFAPEDIIQLGNNLTKGLGAGADPDVGIAAALESKEQIEAAIGNADMLFLTAGMGGGTGTGAIAIIAKTAREMDVLTVAVVTEPFAFEGEKRRAAAAEGLEALRENADSMIVVPNENLLNYLGPDVSLVDAFAAANDVVSAAVQSIAELITTNGLINVDFADVRTVMAEMGHAIMSTGTGMGEFRAEEAAIAAIKSPLLNNIDLKAAKGILVNITSSFDLSIGEFQSVGDIIRQIAADDATVVVGTVFDNAMSHEMKVTVVATGLKPPKKETIVVHNDELAAKLSTPTPTASEKAAADAKAEAKAAAEAAAEARAAAETQAIAEATEARAIAEAESAERVREKLARRHVPRATTPAKASPQAPVNPDQPPPQSTMAADLQAAPEQALQPPPIPPIPPIPSTAQLQQSNTANTPAGYNANNIAKNSTVSVTDVCMICGSINGRHLAKCPWATAEPEVEQIQVADRPFEIEEQPQVTPASKPRNKAKLRNKDKPRKKSGLAVAAVGIFAIASIAWLVVGGKKDKADDLVENATAEEKKPASMYIGGLRSTVPYKIPTLELNAEEIDSVEHIDGNLTPKDKTKDEDSKTTITGIDE